MDLKQTNQPNSVDTEKTQSEDQQSMKIISSPIKRLRLVLPILLLLIIGFGAYYYINNKARSIDKNKDNKQIIVSSYAPFFSLNKNTIIDTANLPEIKTIDPITKEPIYQGVVYHFNLNKEKKSGVIFCVDTEPTDDMVYGYCVDTTTSKIQVVDNGVPREATLDDLEPGSIFKIVGGTEKLCPYCNDEPLYVQNPKQIILLKKPTILPERDFLGDSIDGDYTELIQVNVSKDQGLFLTKNSRFSGGFIRSTWPEEHYLKLENMNSPVKLPNNAMRLNLMKVEKVVMEGNQICPQDNYACFFKAKKATIESLKGGVTDCPFKEIETEYKTERDAKTFFDCTKPIK